ncbi:MAG: hypothetical protein Q8Q52_05300 [Acidimicrobiia bacterium]|nr:hypothetical protein [Acidimicrobiia bacterium]
MGSKPTNGPIALLTAVIVTAGVIAACGGEEAATTTAAPTAQLIVQADTVSGPLNIPNDQMAGRVCVAQSRFARNSEIVWRVRLTDPLTGEQLDDTGVQTLQVKLADGQVLDMHYGDHPRDNPTDKFWTTSFDIPEGYPTGTLGYEVVAVSTSGMTGNFTPFNVAPSLLTITDEVYETIEEGSS